MSAGRFTWRAKPCGWRDRERVVALGEEYGPAGLVVLDVLEELAKEQRGNEGHFRTGLRALARACFLPRGTEGSDLARRVLTFAQQVGALDELDISDDLDMTVTGRISGFAADQGAGYEAIRKANQRAAGQAGQSPEIGDDDTACPEPGDKVPKCPLTEQDINPNSPFEGRDRKVPVKFDGKVVPVATVALAESILVEFNRQAGTSRGPYRRSGKPSDSLTRIIGALVEAEPEITLEEAQRMIRWRLANRFWQGKPVVGVVFGPGTIDQVRENATALTNGRGGTSAVIALSRKAAT